MTDKLVKMHVLTIFITGNISPLVLPALLMSPEIGRNSCLRHAIGNCFKIELLELFPVILGLLCISGEKNESYSG